MVERLKMDGDDGRHAGRHLTDVVGAHDDQPAFEELCAARIHDGNGRRWRSIVSATPSYQTVSPAM